MAKKSLFVLVGARPNFIKLAPLRRALIEAGLPPVNVHSRQHANYRMSEAFFKVLEIPEPDIHLGVRATSRIGQAAEIVSKLEDVFVQHPGNAALTLPLYEKLKSAAARRSNK